MSKSNTKCVAQVNNKDHGVKAGYERDGHPVCKTHRDAKNVTFRPSQLSMPVLQDIEAHFTVTGNMESGAMQNPENTARGIARVKSAQAQSKKEVVMSDTKVEKDSTQLKATVYFCNVPKNQSVKGKVTLFVTKRWMGVSDTLDGLIQRAETRLSTFGGTQRQKKAFVVEFDGKAIVMRTVVEDGKLVLRVIDPVPFETMNLLKSKF